MNKCAVMYFSGTGNTKYISEVMKKTFEDNSVDAELINIEKDKINIKDYNAIIIGGPVYVQRYPEILLKYIEDNLQNYKGRCMLFATQAGDEPTAVFQHALNRLNFLNITYCEYIEMPNNFYNFMFKTNSESECEELFKQGVVKAEEAVQNFIKGEEKYYPMKKSFVRLIDFTYKLFYKFGIKHMINKVEVDKEKCIKCGLCERRCPVKSVKLIKDEVKMNKKCLLCQRCMNSCPKDCFSYKKNPIVQYKAEKYYKKVKCDSDIKDPKMINWK